MLHFTMPVSGRTNGCPEKPGAAHLDLSGMAKQLDLRVCRCLTAHEFASDLKQLKAFRGAFVNDGLL
jgi:hypothetical protein